MFEYYMWTVCFITLYISIFWISIIPYKNPVSEKLKKLPFVSIIVPAYNEEKNISNALDSLTRLEYPKNKIEIIVVDDCSTDDTVNIVKNYIKKYDYIKLLRHDINKGNAAHSVNTALKHARGDLVARVDADSVVNPNSLLKLVHFFSDPEVGAVVSPILLLKTETMIEKIQRFEYILTNFVRDTMAKIHILHYTTGVLTMYRTNLIKKLGYFDEENLTEDLEIALRLIKSGYKLKFEPSNITYTYVPSTFKKFWNQRIRWYRGFLYNSWKYRDMFFNKKYGLIGTFQTPVNLLFLLITISSFILFLYGATKYLYNFIVFLIVTNFDIFNGFKFPDLKYLILSLNVKVLFPLVLTLLFSFYIYRKAYKVSGEKIDISFTTLIYLFIYPFITTFQWIYSIFLELIRVKRKW